MSRNEIGDMVILIHSQRKKIQKSYQKQIPKYYYIESFLINNYLNLIALDNETKIVVREDAIINIQGKTYIHKNN